MIWRVVCDTNVLVSAQIADGAPSRVLEEVADGRVHLVLPEPVREELARVLTAKFAFSDARREDVDRLLVELATDRPDAPPQPKVVTGHPADDAILACAVSARVDVLVTGDRRHLLPLGEHEGVRVMTPQALLAELRATS